MQKYSEGIYVTQWAKLYPGQQFPDPKLYPHMFPSKDPNADPFVNTIDQNNRECTDSRFCPKGLIDYECHLKHKCYLNLANLAIHLVGFTLAFFFILAALAKLSHVLFKLLTSLTCLGKAFVCLGTFLKNVSFGVMGEEIVYVDKYKKQTRKTTQKEQKLLRKLQNIDIEINVEAIDNFQVKKLNELLSDYSLQSQESKNRVEK